MKCHRNLFFQKFLSTFPLFERVVNCHCAMEKTNMSRRFLHKRKGHNKRMMDGSGHGRQTFIRPWEKQIVDMTRNSRSKLNDRILTGQETIILRDISSCLLCEVVNPFITPSQYVLIIAVYNIGIILTRFVTSVASR
jgi:hypothetical protein